VQVLDCGPGYGEAVEGRGAAADLVEDDERAGRRLVQDRRRLDHFDHEGRAAAREIVGGTDAGKQAIHDAEMRCPRRHIGAHLGQHDDERVLAQIRRLATHVRPGDEEDAARLRAGELAIVHDERGAGSLQRRLDNRVPGAFDVKDEAAVDLRSRPIKPHGAIRQGCGHVNERERFRTGRDLPRNGKEPAGHVVEVRELDP
jgi:hypothetical protein